ncbi:MAG: type IIL restriction-modification enzyme MmeI, partial [Treponema sp.]
MDARRLRAAQKRLPLQQHNRVQQFSVVHAHGRAKAAIEQTAQGILDARSRFPDSSLADLYDEAAMPPALRKAHRTNDKAVLAAYNLPADITESACVA